LDSVLGQHVSVEIGCDMRLNRSVSELWLPKWTKRPVRYIEFHLGDILLNSELTETTFYCTHRIERRGPRLALRIYRFRISAGSPTILTAVDTVSYLKDRFLSLSLFIIILSFGSKLKSHPVSAAV